MSNSVEKPDISKYEWMGNDEQDLFVTLTLAENANEIRDFLVDLLSIDEIKNAAKRWRVARSLMEGEKQADILAEFGASKNMVSRVNNAIVKYGTGISKNLNERMKKAMIQG